ncbi:release factor glutamine methyltransferase [Seinonella peptonophila]|uniref:Release factor glutamine methyltransferase n=1 Tax=Seinonella peptonophila TaxID=112248 RepID=A0A1M4XVY7_9BACL|nr:peptide chain release factor N(5)-glutamine methyltransferase [Seinonella peptonophila]SHE97422.1 release factor glutamine methyltransferase [Seinonella peptonophila]
MTTLREAFQEASSFLEKCQIDDPAFEAEWLITALLDCTRTQLFLSWEHQLSTEQIQQLHGWLHRRCKQEPLQYIVGKQSFYGRDFIVNPAVLIPRPETEGLVERVIQLISDNFASDESLYLVDVGTGSGAIAITCALELPQLQVIAIDRSSAALEVAKQNTRKYGLEERISFYNGDLLSPLESINVQAQIIVSNPPYIDQTAYQGLEKQVKGFEPRLALDGGEDGLTIYRRLATQIAHLPQPPRHVVLEIGYDQGKTVPELFRFLAINGCIQVEPDLAGHDRVVWFSMARDDLV